MNEEASMSTLEGIVCEVGKDREGNPFTAVYVGRWIDPVILRRNGLDVGTTIFLTGRVLTSTWTSRKGKTQDRKFVVDAEVKLV